MRIKIMSKGEIQLKSIPSNIAIVNFYSKSGYSLIRTQNHSLSKNESLLLLNEKGLICDICADDVEIEKPKKGFFNRIFGSTEELDFEISYLTTEHCEKIINFILKNKGKTFVFQSDEGVSRCVNAAIFAKKYILKDHIVDNKRDLIREDLIKNVSFYNLLVDTFNNRK